MSLAETFHRQLVTKAIRSAEETAELPESQQGEGETSLHSFYCRRVFCGNGVDDYTVLRDKLDRLTDFEPQSCIPKNCQAREAIAEV